MIRRRLIVMTVAAMICFSMTLLVDASYTILKTDATDYDYADHDGSIWGFGSITHSKYTGEETVLGQTPWWGGLHTVRLDMWISFEAAEDGQVTCSAKWSMSYRLKATTTTGTRSELWIYYVLYNSAKSHIETSSWVYHAKAYRSGGEDDIVEDIVNENHGVTRQFDTELNDGSTYWVSVRIYLEIYGTHANVYSKGSTSPLTLDINEIKVCG